MTEPVRGMGLVLVLRHKLHYVHVYKGLLWCKSVCDVKPGLDPCPLLAQSWNRWWLDFITFIAYKKIKIKFKKAKCVLNRCNDLFKRKKYFGFRCTLIPRYIQWNYIRIQALVDKPSMKSNPVLVRIEISLKAILLTLFLPRQQEIINWLAGWQID